MNDQSSRSHAIFSLTLTQRRYTGQASPPRSSSNTAAFASDTSAGTFSTPIKAAHRQSAIPGRVNSPTPGASPRPGTPGDGTGRPPSRLLPRPSSALGGRTDIRAPSPNMVTRRGEKHNQHQQNDEDGSEDKTAQQSGGSMNNDNEWTTVTSKFHFVDLAGSERVSGRAL